MKPILIKHGRLIDPAQGLDEISDVLLMNGLVEAIGANLAEPENATIVDAQGFVVSPGFVDLHCHLRDPGYQHKETIATGTAAAARGGFTTVCAMPNTTPPADSQPVIEYVLSAARDSGLARVLPIGCITKGSEGKELAEMGSLAEAGVVAFSDDGAPVSNAHIMQQALYYSSQLGLPIINHCEDTSLSANGSMNAGWVATRLGLNGIPNSAEEVMVARDIHLAELTGGHVHIAHASTAGTAELVRKAKTKGLKITCEVTPHHLTLTDEAVLGSDPDGDMFRPLSYGAYDTSAKVSPPLRSNPDRLSMIKAVNDGTVDHISTDHAPHGITDKMCSFGEASNGISVLETALGSLMSLVHSGALSLPLLIEKLTSSPAKFVGLNIGTLKPGFGADVTIIDPNSTWVVDPSKFASKGKNTPLSGKSLKGSVVTTIYQGNIVYKASS
jgi:dihydroorotase